MPKKDYTNFRQVLGQFLNTRREELDISMYQFKKLTGLSDGQSKAVFNGDASYTIDSLFAAVEALDAYFYFAARDNDKSTMDEADFFKKMMDADPED